MRIIAFLIVIASCLHSYAQKVNESHNFDLNSDFSGNRYFPHNGNVILVRHDGLIKSYTLGLSLRSLLGEPVVDNSFSWTINEHYFLSVTKHTSYEQLQKYPDLVERYNNLKPSNVIVRVNLAFRDAFGTDFAYADLMVKPDLIMKSGQSSGLHVSGSPSWSEVFDRQTSFSKLSEILTPSTHSTDSEMGKFHKKLFFHAHTISIQKLYVSITYDAPFEGVQAILREYLRREKKKDLDPDPKEVTEELEEFWEEEDSELEEMLSDENTRNDILTGEETLESLQSKEVKKEVVSPKTVGSSSIWSEDHACALYSIIGKDGKELTKAEYMNEPKFKNGQAKIRKLIKSEIVSSDSEYCDNKAIKYWYRLYYCVERTINSSGELVSSIPEKKVLVVKFRNQSKLKYQEAKATGLVTVERKKSCLKVLDKKKQVKINQAKSLGYEIDD